LGESTKWLRQQVDYQALETVAQALLDLLDLSEFVNPSDWLGDVFELRVSL